MPCFYFHWVSLVCLVILILLHKQFVSLPLVTSPTCCITKAPGYYAICVLCMCKADRGLHVTQKSALTVQRNRGNKKTLTDRCRRSGEYMCPQQSTVDDQVVKSDLQKQKQAYHECQTSFHCSLWDSMHAQKLETSIGVRPALANKKVSC